MLIVMNRSIINMNKDKQYKKYDKNETQFNAFLISTSGFT